MAGIQGTPTTVVNTAEATQPAVIQGGKDGARPTHTAMGTPIIYGKSYLPNYTRDYRAPLVIDNPTINPDLAGGGGTGGSDSGNSSGGGSSDANAESAAAIAIDDASISEGVTDSAASAAESAAAIAVDDASISEGVTQGEATSSDSSDGDSSGGDSGDGGSSGDGATGASGGYANGTTYVRGYAYGTTGVDDDPWAWTNAKPPAAPLSASIQPSNEQALARMPDRTEQQLASMAMGKGIDAAEKGITEGYKVYKLAGPLAQSQAVSQAAATDMALGGAGGSAGAAALTEAAGTGAAIAETGAAASALGAGGTAMMGALASNPVGWAIGAGLLAKKLKIF
jgi:hypothetical protein